jgi:hypothetical protein
MKPIVALLLLLGTSLVQAEPLTWYLQDVQFSDGGSASGSFDYDADSNTYSNVSVVATDSSGNPSTIYGFGMLNAEFTPSASSVSLSVGPEPIVQSSELMLAFVSPLTAAGGSVAISTTESLSKEGLCAQAPPNPDENLSCYGGGLIDWRRTVAQGAVTTAMDAE